MIFKKTPVDKKYDAAGDDEDGLSSEKYPPLGNFNTVRQQGGCFGCGAIRKISSYPIVHPKSGWGLMDKNGKKHFVFCENCFAKLIDQYTEEAHGNKYKALYRMCMYTGYYYDDKLAHRVIEEEHKYDDNTPVPATMSLQEVLDAIFYGKGISISAPDYVTINNKVPITLCVHGSTGLIDVAELYQDGKLTISFVKEDFENGCVTVDSLPIIEDTEFTFKVTYTNEAVHEESITVKAALPIFVGLLPKWKFGNVITWNYLEELASEEPNNNQFINSSNNLN